MKKMVAAKKAVKKAAVKAVAKKAVKTAAKKVAKKVVKTAAKKVAKAAEKKMTSAPASTNMGGRPMAKSPYSAGNMGGMGMGGMM